MKKKLHLIMTMLIMCMLSLTGCGQKEEVEVTEPVEEAESLAHISPVVSEDIPVPLEKYNDVLKINPYVAGWLKIDDSVIDCPVVYTPGSQNYYLHRDIDGTYAEKGTLFIAINWRDDYNNTIIYGHNMKDGTAFGSLDKFAKESYGRSHDILHFDTLYEERDYELYAAFYSQIADEDLETDEDRAAADAAVEEGEIDLLRDFGDWDLYRQEKDEDNGRFRYYYYTDLSDKDDFDYFARNVKERALYDTGIEAEWGDEFVTLSTCSYHVRNGRFVVVGIRKK
ncbi:MAG: class B sortase [Lachnospiraceae bacterium]|nr:class B sortase [Lachnospiraceae bacterium]